MANSFDLLKNQAQALQLQTQLLDVQVQAEGLKEYAADWLKEAKTVTRDATGKFASKASSVAKDLDSKINSTLLIAANKALEKLIKNDPEFASNLTQKMFGIDAQQARDRLADRYAKINPGLANAIRPDPFKEILDDLKRLRKNNKATDKKILAKDIQRTFKLAAQKYDALLEKLNNLEDQPKAIQLMGKLAAAGIPLSIYLAAVLGPEFAIGAITKSTLSEILGSIAIGQAASVAADKIMDKAKIENPFVKFGVDIAVNIGAALSLIGAVKILKKKMAGEVATEAKKVATEAEEVATEAEEVATEAKKDIATNKTAFSKEIVDEFKKRKAAELFADTQKQKWGRNHFTNLSAIESRLSELLKDFTYSGSIDAEKDIQAHLEKMLVKEWSNPNVSMQQIIDDAEMGFTEANGKRWVEYIKKTEPVKESKYYGSVDVKVSNTSELDFEERKLITKYTDDLFLKTNETLRGNIPPNPETLDSINRLTKALSKLPGEKSAEFIKSRFLSKSSPLTQTLIDNLESNGLKVGDTLVDPAFFSTSPSPVGTIGFQDSEPAQALKILIRPSKKSIGRDITSLNGAGELEVLYPPGMEFKILKKEKRTFYDYKGNPFQRWVVEVEEV